MSSARRAAHPASSSTPRERPHTHSAPSVDCARARPGFSLQAIRLPGFWGSWRLQSLSLLFVAFAACLLKARALLVSGIGGIVAEVLQNLLEQLAQLVLEFGVRKNVEAVLAHRLEHASSEHVRLHA